MHRSRDSQNCPHNQRLCAGNMVNSLIRWRRTVFRSSPSSRAIALMLAPSVFICESYEIPSHQSCRYLAADEKSQTYRIFQSAPTQTQRFSSGIAKLWRGALETNLAEAIKLRKSRARLRTPSSNCEFLGIGGSFRTSIYIVDIQ